MYVERPQEPEAQPTAWLDQIEAEHANLQAALEWCFAHGETELGRRLCIAMVWFWRSQGHLNEGQLWLVN